MNNLSLKDTVWNDPALQGLLDDPANADNPLRPVVIRLLSTIQKLERRLDKVSNIADRYQAQLKDTNEKLDEAARTDLLTKLPNRRFLTERLSEEINLVHRIPHDFSILLIDIDYFKRVNDTYGHMTGDLVLEQVAECLKGNLRNTDHCCRWGGEEFLILLPYTNEDGAKVIAERLRQAVAGMTIAGSQNSILLTISIGGTCYDPDQTLDQVLSIADAMLYQAKSDGRNRVCIKSYKTRSY